MNIEQLKNIISEGESKMLEFKTSTANLDKTFEGICAFLNNNGGTLLIGVKDNGDFVGQKITDSTRREIANKILKIEPAQQHRLILTIHPLRQIIILLALGYHLIKN